LFRGETTAATLHKLLHAEIPPPSSVNPELAPLDILFTRALAREMEGRFQSADEFIEAIEEAAAGFGGLASLRKVGKAVKFYAADKLARDKHLISDAVRGLGIDKEGSPSLAPYLDVPDTTSPSQASMGSGSGSSSSSLSAVSGRHSGVTLPSSKMGRPPVPPPPPRPRGPGFGPESSGSSSSAIDAMGGAAASGSRVKRKVLVAVGALTLVGVGLWAWLGSRNEEVRVTAMEAREVAVPEPPPTDAPPPAAHEPASGDEAATPPATVKPEVAGEPEIEAPAPPTNAPTAPAARPERRPVRPPETSVKKPERQPEATQAPAPPAPAVRPAPPPPTDDFPPINPYRVSKGAP
jgi:hypothetical protein